MNTTDNNNTNNNNNIPDSNESANTLKKKGFWICGGDHMAGDCEKAGKIEDLFKSQPEIANIPENTQRGMVNAHHGSKV